jgi:hypothetical protein
MPGIAKIDAEIVDEKVKSADLTVEGVEDNVPADLRHKIKVSPGVQLRDTHLDFPDGGLVAWLVLAGVSRSDLHELLCHIPTRRSSKISLPSGIQHHGA